MKIQDIKPEKDRKTFRQLVPYGGESVASVSLPFRNLTSLKGAPNVVYQSFDVSNNLLTDLTGCPKLVNITMDVSNNPLKRIYHRDNEKIKVGQHFVCDECRLTNLHNIHHYIEEIGGVLNASGNNIESHILGVFLINQLQLIRLGHYKQNKQVEAIVNKWLNEKHARGLDKRVAMLECQQELIDNGFEEYAQL